MQIEKPQRYVVEPHRLTRTTVTFIATILLLCSALLIWPICDYHSRLTGLLSPSVATSGAPSLHKHLWAVYAPYFPAAEYKPLPRNCKVTQVNASPNVYHIWLIFDTG